MTLINGAARAMRYVWGGTKQRYIDRDDHMKWSGYDIGSGFDENNIRLIQILESQFKVSKEKFTARAPAKPRTFYLRVKSACLCTGVCPFEKPKKKGEKKGLKRKMAIIWTPLTLNLISE